MDYVDYIRQQTKNTGQMTNKMNISTKIAQQFQTSFLWSLSEKRFVRLSSSDISSENTRKSRMNSTKTKRNAHGIHVLNDFQPYLYILTAYNRDNFDRNKTKWRSICYAFITTIFILLECYLNASSIWYLIEIFNNFYQIAPLIPLVVSVARDGLSFIALILKNRTMIETINRLQKVVDQREHHFYFVFLSL